MAAARIRAQLAEVRQELARRDHHGDPIAAEEMRGWVVKTDRRFCPPCARFLGVDHDDGDRDAEPAVDPPGAA